MEEQLSAILGNPEMMAKIQTLAGSLGTSAPKSEASEVDPQMLQKVATVMAKASIDERQQKLLDALGCYLSAGRIEKLRKAMRAAKLADMAGMFLNGR